MGNLLKRIFIFAIFWAVIQMPVFAYEFNDSFSKNDVIYKSSAARINYINPTQQSNQSASTYPGYRGPNQLIIYTPDYGRKTGTNEFGTEAIVVNGFVKSISGADSLIPSNGFVISGHGQAKDWINKNIVVGSKIVVNPYSMIVASATTPETYLFAANEKIKEVFSFMKYYNHQNVPYDYTTSVDYLKKSRKALSQATKQKDNLQKYSTTAIQNAEKAIEYSIPYYNDEVKGVWIRPTQKTKEEIADTLNKIKSAGINNVFLETFYHAKTIYPSDVLRRYNIRNQRQEFVGADPLKIWIEEAHARNIKVHVWFECFYVGNDNPYSDPNHILNVYPEWANTTKANYESEGPTPSSTEHNGYFLDPANPEVQTLLLEVINEIVSKYNPDGVNLDYIRYPQTVDKKSPNYENLNWGYTKFAREEFKNTYEIDPVEISKNTRDWDLWAKYRQDKITDFIKKANDVIRKRSILTAVIFPDRQRSLDTKMQDWRTWSHKNYVDGFTPLILTCDYETAKSLLNDIKNHSSRNTDIYPGIFVSFMNGSIDDMLNLIHMTRQLKTKGLVIFDYAHFKPQYVNAVTASAFTPLNDKTLKKIQSGEISQKKLQTFLDKSIKEFYYEEALLESSINNKNNSKNTYYANNTKNIKETKDTKDTKEVKNTKNQVKKDADKQEAIKSKTNPNDFKMNKKIKTDKSMSVDTEKKDKAKNKKNIPQNNKSVTKEGSANADK